MSKSTENSLDIKLPAAGKKRKGLSATPVKPMVLPPPRIKGVSKGPKKAISVVPVSDENNADRTAELEKELSELKADYEMAQKRLNDIDTTRKKPSKNIPALDWSELESLEGRDMPVQVNNDVIHAETKLYAEIETLKSRITERDKTIEKLESRLTEESESVTEADPTLQDNIAVLEQALADKEEKISALQSKVSDLEETSSRLKASLAQAEDQLSATAPVQVSAQELIEKDKWIADLEAQLEQKAQDLAAAKKLIENASDSMVTAESPSVGHALPVPKVDGPPLYEDIQKKLDDLQSRCRSVLDSIAKPESAESEESAPVR